MTFTPLPPATNRLIESLPRRERAELLAICRPVPLVLSEVLTQPGEVPRHVWFPTSGYVSLVSELDGTLGVVVGMVGSEGLLGVQMALGVNRSDTTGLVQGSGSALRAEAGTFRRLLAGSAALQRLLHRYLYVRMRQLTSVAPCLRFHFIEPRLARWLLMSHDRANAPVFEMTHAFLSHMLGVRRAGVTMAATLLQARGLIEYSRGKLVVLDRQGLEDAACSCYATDRALYAATLGVDFPLRPGQP